MRQLRDFYSFLKKVTSRPAVVARAEVRPTDGQGPFTAAFKTYVARKVEGTFYEIMREAVPFLDAGVNRLVSLEGNIKIVGNNEALVEEIKEWVHNVKVDDFQIGLQAFHRLLSDEAFEQGFAIGEYVTDKARKDIMELHVADSKTIQFRREANDRATIHQKITSDMEPRELKPDNLLYFAPFPEAKNPYGISIFRSLEFGSKVFATINNTILNNFERWGDPSLHVHYKGAGVKNGDDLKAVRDELSTDLATAFRAKRDGKTADLVTAGNLQSDLTIKVIGQDGQVLNIEVPARFVVEQFVAKLGLAPWMIGIHWGTTERLSDAEASVFMADVYNRQRAKGPLFYNLIRTLLLLRGRAWKPGDWGIEWEQVHLHDMLKKAQAKFLNAQADMMTGGEGEDGDGSKGYTVRDLRRVKTATSSSSPCGCSGNKELHRTEPWPELDTIETEYEDTLKVAWSELQDNVLNILGLGEPGVPKTAKAMKAGKDPLTPDGLPELDAFTFSNVQRVAIMDAFKDFEGKFEIKNPDSPVKFYYGRAHSAGLLQAALMIGKERPILDFIQNSQMLEQLYEDGFKLVKNKSTLYLKDKILPEMDAQVLAGTNPLHVAARLKKRFGEANAEWNRLTRTEMSKAGEEAKLVEWKKQGINVKDAVVAGPDTHPN